MLSRLSRVQWGAIAVTAGALAVAGCSSSSSETAAAKPSSSTSSAGSQGSPSGTLTASQAVQRAAQNAGKVTSFAATVNVQTTGTATSTISGTLEQRTAPTPLIVANFSKVTAQGQTIPGGIQEILDSSAVYLKLAQLAQATGKPWIKIPASEMSQLAGGSFGQLLQNNSSNPLLQTQMLASSTNVKKVGTTTLNGVPVTEYTGTYPISAGLAKLPADLRSKVAQQLQAMGLQTENFQIWLDHSEQVRKVVTSAQGSKEQVTSTIEVTAINEPVSVAIPPASQTATVPASELGASGQARPGTS
jgi:hypothetical protein